MTYQELGTLIRQERKKRHLTQIELAQLAEIAVRTMKSMEKGERTHEKSIRKVMDILSYDIEINISVSIK
ncbi:MAG: helix-turn-helix domain-containing protein, partial [Chitinophagales bacterium]